jgi:hypothetical protein
MSMALIGSLSLTGLSTAYSKDTVSLKVAVVHASKIAGKSDKKISARMGKSLRTAFGQFKSFQQLTKTTLKLKKGKRVAVNLPTKDKAVVVYDGKSGKKHRISLLIPEHKVRMKLSAPAKKLFYQAGIRYKNGILILAFYLKE